MVQTNVAAGPPVPGDLPMASVIGKGRPHEKAARGRLVAIGEARSGALVIASQQEAADFGDPSTPETAFIVPLKKGSPVRADKLRAAQMDVAWRRQRLLVLRACGWRRFLSKVGIRVLAPHDVQRMPFPRRPADPRDGASSNDLAHIGPQARR